jgi:hypothetical protein
MAVTTPSAVAKKKHTAPAKNALSRKAQSIAKNKRSHHSITPASSRKPTIPGLHNEHKYVEQAAEDFALAEIIGLSAFTESIGTFSSTFSQINNVVRTNSGRALRNNRQSYRRFWASDQRNMHDFMSISADCAMNSYDTFTDIMKDIGVLIRKARGRISEPYSTRIQLYQDLTQDDAGSSEHTHS